MIFDGANPSCHITCNTYFDTSYFSLHQAFENNVQGFCQKALPNESWVLEKGSVTQIRRSEPRSKFVLTLWPTPFTLVGLNLDKFGFSLEEIYITNCTHTALLLTGP